jgi:hypothetical protein
MDRYIIMHPDRDGEMQQLTGAWDATSAADAIAQMLAEVGEPDDGEWHAQIVTCERDVIE